VHMHIKEMKDMPSNDHTGPQGNGPMTGRKLGECANNGDQNDAPRLGRNRRLGQGQGRDRGNAPRRGLRRR